MLRRLSSVAVCCSESDPALGAPEDVRKIFAKWRELEPRLKVETFHKLSLGARHAINRALLEIERQLVDGVRKCNAGHELIEEKVPYHANCDTCGRFIGYKNEIWRCQRCKYDLCGFCEKVEADEREHQSVRARLATAGYPETDNRKRSSLDDFYDSTLPGNQQRTYVEGYGIDGPDVRDRPGMMNLSGNQNAAREPLRTSIEDFYAGDLKDHTRSSGKSFPRDSADSRGTTRTSIENLYDGDLRSRDGRSSTQSDSRKSTAIATRQTQETTRSSISDLYDDSFGNHGHRCSGASDRASDHASDRAHSRKLGSIDETEENIREGLAHTRSTVEDLYDGLGGNDPIAKTSALASVRVSGAEESTRSSISDLYDGTFENHGRASDRILSTFNRDNDPQAHPHTRSSVEDLYAGLEAQGCTLANDGNSST